MYLVYKTKCAFSHALVNRKGLQDKICLDTHKHNDVRITVAVSWISAIFLDFKIIKAVVEEFVQKINNNNLNDVLEFIDPTTEFLAEEIRRFVSDKLLDLGYGSRNVRVYIQETPKYGVLLLDNDKQ